MLRRRYGWRPDVPDHRDRFRAAPVRLTQGLPPTVDPRLSQGPIKDQGRIGSCTGHGIAGSLEMANKRNGELMTPLSALFAYYNARLLAGSVKEDGGASIRDAVKGAARWGCCPQTAWPYDEKKFASRPPSRAYESAKSSLALVYERQPQSRDLMKATLAEGLDIVLGISLYESFESEDVAGGGVVPMPKATETMLGGHCVRLIGYTDVALRDAPAGSWILANSWGEAWGARGYFFLPYMYLMNPGLADDLWVIRKAA